MTCNLNEVNPTYKEKLQILADALNHNRKVKAALMIWDLYTDNILNSYEASEAIICMGFGVVRDHNGYLKSIKLD